MELLSDFQGLPRLISSDHFQFFRVEAFLVRGRDIAEDGRLVIGSAEGSFVEEIVFRVVGFFAVVTGEMFAELFGGAAGFLEKANIRDVCEMVGVFMLWRSKFAQHFS